MRIRINVSPPDIDNIAALLIYESPTEGGSFTLIDTITDVGVFPNYKTAYSTNNATSTDYWFEVAWRDTNNNVSDPTSAVQGGTAPNEILATLDDINGNLPSDADSPVVVADDNNTALLQISVARVVRGYLSRVIDNGTLVNWNNPDNTPDIIREVAGKLIASQLYFNETAKTTAEVNENHFSQRLYNEAMVVLNQIIAGDILVPTVVVTAVEGLGDLDYFPVDSTDRAFTLSMRL